MKAAYSLEYAQSIPLYIYYLNLFLFHNYNLIKNNLDKELD